MSFFDPNYSIRQNLSELFPPKPQWEPKKDMPDQKGKVFLVTGGNTGIGKETCRVLLSHSATVYLASRSVSKATAAIDSIVSELGGDVRDRVHFLELDLGDLKNVKRAGEELKKRVGERDGGRLDGVVCNAGVMAPPLGSKTNDGIEIQFGTNVVGHHLLIQTILPLLLQTAKSNPSSSPRIVHVSSSGHSLCPPEKGIELDQIGKRGTKGGGWWFLGGVGGKMEDYGASKLGNILISNEISRRYSDQGIISVSLNPGNIQTDLPRHVTFMRLLARFVCYPVTLGALTQLYCLTYPDLPLGSLSTSTSKTDQDGQKEGNESKNENENHCHYFIPWGRKGLPQTKWAYDEGLAKKVWEWCEEKEEEVLNT